MPDATYFSIDVAVAKARNVAYYDNPSQLQPIDKIKGVAGRHGADGPDVPLPLVAVLPRGDRHQPARPGLDPQRWRRDQVRHDQGRPLPAKAFTSLQGFDDFNPNTNFQTRITWTTRTASCSSPAARRLYKDKTAAARRAGARRRPGGQRRRRVPGRRRDRRGGDRLRPAQTIKRADHGESPRRPPAVSSSSTATRTSRSAASRREQRSRPAPAPGYQEGCKIR